MNNDKFIIWSNEHQMWWKPNRQGYCVNKNNAGEYTYDQACVIVELANKFQKVNEIPNETMVKVYKKVDFHVETKNVRGNIKNYSLPR